MDRRSLQHHGGSGGWKKDQLKSVWVGKKEKKETRAIDF